MGDFTDAEWAVFTVCIMVDAFAASVFFGVLVYYKLTCLFSRHGRWTGAGDRLADRKWGRGNWEYSDGQR